MDKKVTIIEAAGKQNESGKKLRVCAYARVSSMHEDQQNSFSAQCNFYSNYIRDNPDWEYIGIYADLGISGKSKQNRTEFLRMIDDARNHAFDLILAKSISRFARNVTDCLETVRELRQLGIGVEFEKENINTLSAESELLLTILSSIAEEELSNLSENIRWSNQRRYKNGEVQIVTERFMGYDRNEDGELIINEDQAKVVRQIFDMYVSGLGATKIARELDRAGIKPISGGERWSRTVIRSMLKNEKFVGDAILQKTVTANTVTFKRKKNEGEAPMYYIKNNHPAIIDRETFDLVQNLIKERRIGLENTLGITWKQVLRYPFSGKITCGKCGGTYRHINRKKEEWVCQNFKDERFKGCDVGSTRDITIKLLFVRMFNKLWQNDYILTDYSNILENLIKAKQSEGRINNYDKAISELFKQEEKLLELRTKGYVNESVLLLQHKENAQNIEILQKERGKILKSIENGDLRLKSTRSAMSLIKQYNKPMKEFNEMVFKEIVDRITIPKRGEIIFHLKNGLDLRETFTWRIGNDLIEEGWI